MAQLAREAVQTSKLKLETWKLKMLVCKKPSKNRKVFESKISIILEHYTINDDGYEEQLKFFILIKCLIIEARNVFLPDCSLKRNNDMKSLKFNKQNFLIEFTTLSDVKDECSLFHVL